MSWTRLTAKKAREEMGRDAEYDFDPADIARQVADEFPNTDVLASPPPLRPGNVAADTYQPSAELEQKEEKLPRPKSQGRGPSKRNLPVSTPVAIPEDADWAEAFIHGILSEAQSREAIPDLFLRWQGRKNRRQVLEQGFNASLVARSLLQSKHNVQLEILARIWKGRVNT
ncbi:hypothetical protein R1sor_007803 [Riccia sorocarpa]|uniref:Uncharacterized protein n=1 Tax=Riccia sorocarpa TaxID=122646 RepID=A0ABD3HV05_9MARC